METLLSEITPIELLLLFNLIGVVCTLLFLQNSSFERRKINRETFGLLKKVEGLVARKQEAIVREYDALLEKMTNQVPVMIAQQAGKDIYATEKYILTRLAEIEPELKGDAVALQKMETIVHSLESLEDAVIRATSHAVEAVLVDKRKSLFGGQHCLTEDESVNLRM